MFTTEAEYRQAVLDALGRMAEIEDMLRVEASESGDEYLEGIHEHGAVVLREASRAIEGLAGE